MTNTQVIEFSSKYCKSYSHNTCHGVWIGLGFQIKCTCSCHLKNQAHLQYNSYSKENNNLDQNNDSGKRSAKLYFPLALLEKSHSHVKVG
ncbi:hypothetical protein BH23THE1_BH23THE1_17390 [soil metagenome]